MSEPTYEGRTALSILIESAFEQQTKGQISGESRSSLRLLVMDVRDCYYEGEGPARCSGCQREGPRGKLCTSCHG